MFFFFVSQAFRSKSASIQNFGMFDGTQIRQNSKHLWIFTIISIILISALQIARAIFLFFYLIKKAVGWSCPVGFCNKWRQGRFASRYLLSVGSQLFDLTFIFTILRYLKYSFLSANRASFHTLHVFKKVFHISRFE